MTSRSDMKIAFVDDDVRLLSSHKRNFGRIAPDWTPLFFESPQAALEAISNDTTVQAAVLDMHMPDLGGLELAEKLRHAREDLIIVMLTGYADLQSALTAVNEFGVFRFYPKPTNLAIILDGIRSEVNRRIGSSTDELPSVFLDLFHMGMIATDAQLSILHMNAQAAEMLRRITVLQISPSNRLIIDHAPDDLEKFLIPPGNRVPPIQRGFSIETEEGRLSVFLRRIRRNTDEPDKFIMVMVEPDRQTPPTVDDLMDVFGLTRSEAKLTQRLSEGMSLEQASEAVGLSISSGRTYLKNIFSKTGVNRQPQLLKTILSSIPALYHTNSKN